MINQTLWDAGLTVKDYISKSEHFRAELQERVRDVRLTPFEKNQLKPFDRPVKVFVLTESWCSDSLMNLPILAKIEEVCPSLTVRVYPRSQFEALAQFFGEQCLAQIPLFWFTDAEFKHLGTWMERPAGAERLIKRWKAANPELEAIRNDPDLSKEEKKAQVKPIMADFVDEAWNWYDTGLQSETIGEIFGILGLK